MQTPSPSNPLRKMCKRSFCHISPLSRYVMAEPEKKIRMSIDTGMVVVIFISLMYMVLVFGLLFYVKNEWCDLLFKNMTVSLLTTTSKLLDVRVGQYWQQVLEQNTNTENIVQASFYNLDLTNLSYFCNQQRSMSII